MAKHRNFDGFKAERREYKRLKAKGILTVIVCTIATILAVGVICILIKYSKNKSIAEILTIVSSLVILAIATYLGFTLISISNDFDMGVNFRQYKRELHYCKVRIEQYNQLNEYTMEEYIEIQQERDRFNSKMGLLGIDLCIDYNFSLNVPLDLDMTRIKIPSCVMELTLETKESYSISKLNTIEMSGSDNLIIVEHSYPCNMNVLKQISNRNRKIYTGDYSVKRLLEYANYI